MTRIAFVLGLALGAAACNKPAPEDCRKALDNMQRLLGTDGTTNNGDIEGEVRRCKGGSSKAAVQCAIDAKTMDELNKCQFMTTKKK